MRDPTYRDLVKELNLSAAELAYVEDSQTAVTAEMTQSRAVGVVYAVKHAQMLVDKFIGSAESLASSNEKYARRLTWLTAGLVVFAAAQVVVALIK